MSFAICAFAAPQLQFEICQINRGWRGAAKNNQASAAAEGKYLTAVRAALHEVPEGEELSLSYEANISGEGWTGYGADGSACGEAGGTKPLEALRFSLSGASAEQYTVFYQVKQAGAWTDWVQDGETAGTEGQGLFVEGVKLCVTLSGRTPWGRYVDPERPMVALTFDDGPHAEYTARVLKALEENNARATFFMLGQNVEGNHEVIPKMAELGCELGNHSYMHNQMTKQSYQEIYNTMAKTNAAVEQYAGGKRVTALRPPYGDFNDNVRAATRELDMPIILWDIDTLDWKHKNPQKSYETVMEQVHDGAVILFHDIYQSSAEAAELVIPALTEAGYQLVTISELAQYRGGAEAGKAYRNFKKNE